MIICYVFNVYGITHIYKARVNRGLGPSQRSNNRGQHTAIFKQHSRCQHKMTSGAAPGDYLPPPQLRPTSPLSEKEIN